MRSMPLRSDMSTRLTRGTGASRCASGYQMNASAMLKSGALGGAGASRSNAVAMRWRTSPSGTAVEDLSGAAIELPVWVAPHSGAGRRPQGAPALQKSTADAHLRGADRRPAADIAIG